jgi:hypothetical protein
MYTFIHAAFLNLVLEKQSRIYSASWVPGLMLLARIKAKQTMCKGKTFSYQQLSTKR